MGHDDKIERYRIPVDEYVRRSQENLGEYEEIRGRLERGEGFDIEGGTNWHRATSIRW